MRIDVSAPSNLDLRLPSGNELGANPLWISGGVLPGNRVETVLNSIPTGQFTETSIQEYLRRLNN